MKRWASLPGLGTQGFSSTATGGGVAPAPLFADAARRDVRSSYLPWATHQEPGFDSPVRDQTPRYHSQEVPPEITQITAGCRRRPAVYTGVIGVCITPLLEVRGVKLLTDTPLNGYGQTLPLSKGADGRKAVRSAPVCVTYTGDERRPMAHLTTGTLRVSRVAR